MTGRFSQCDDTCTTDCGHGIRWSMNGDGDERVTFTGLTGEHRQVWRQVGWIGQTGCVYPLGLNPALTEPGGFAPLWLLVDDEPTPVREEEDRA